MKNNDIKSPELSVIIPCLNEAETLKSCIQTVKNVFREHNLNGELIVADNDSHDPSIAIALNQNAIVTYAPQKGYGSAIMTGISVACGRYIIVGDGDGAEVVFCALCVLCVGCFSVLRLICVTCVIINALGLKRTCLVFAFFVMLDTVGIIVRVFGFWEILSFWDLMFSR